MLTNPAPQCSHYSLANAQGSGDEGNLPVLLRRMAELIENLGNINVLDLVADSEIGDEQETWSLTVYFVSSDSGSST
jgi:hypothetical protein